MAWSSSSVAVASSYPYHFSPSSRTSTVLCFSPKQSEAVSSTLLLLRHITVSNSLLSLEFLLSRHPVGGPLYVTVSPRRHPPLRYNYIHTVEQQQRHNACRTWMGGGVSFTFHIHNIPLMMSPVMILLLLHHYQLKATSNFTFSFRAYIPLHCASF